MSKMFDYISGKAQGREAELEATIEHLMAHCVPACALDEQRAATIEECAKVAETCHVVTEYGREKIATAIRALKDKP